MLLLINRFPLSQCWAIYGYEILVSLLFFYPSGYVYYIFGDKIVKKIRQFFCSITPLRAVLDIVKAIHLHKKFGYNIAPEAIVGPIIIGTLDGLWRILNLHIILIWKVFTTLFYSYCIAYRTGILVQVTIYRRLLVGRDDHLDQSEAYDIS